MRYSYTLIRNFNDQGNGYTWGRWAGVVNAPVATPVVTVTWSGATPTKAAIAAGILNGIDTTKVSTIFGLGYWSQQRQVSPAGTNAQSSGASNLLAGSNSANYTVAGYGYSVPQAAAPAAGTGFTSIGTVWSGFGAANATYETLTQIGGGVTETATFTPVTGNTYTFLAVYPNLPLPVAPSGPMPKQLYIMP